METSIIAAMILVVFTAGCIAIKFVMKAVKRLEDELSGLEELLAKNGTLSVEDALYLCEKLCEKEV